MSDETEAVPTLAAPDVALAWSKTDPDDVVEYVAVPRWRSAAPAVAVAVGFVVAALLVGGYFMAGRMDKGTNPYPGRATSSAPAPTPPVAPTTTAVAPAPSVAAPPTTTVTASPAPRSILPPGNSSPYDHSDQFLADAHRMGFTSIQGDYGLLQESSDVCVRLAHGEDPETLAREMSSGSDSSTAMDFINLAMRDWQCP